MAAKHDELKGTTYYLLYPKYKIEGEKNKQSHLTHTTEQAHCRKRQLVLQS